MSLLTLTMDANINGFTACVSRMSPVEMFEKLPVRMRAVPPCQNNYGGKCPHCPHASAAYVTVVNPQCVCAARVTVVGCVCLLSHISPMEHLFILKTLSMKVKK